MTAYRDSASDKMREVLGQHLKGMVTHFVTVGEMIGEDGSYYAFLLDDGDERVWVKMGLLQYALDELSSDTDDDDPEEDEDD